MIYLTPLFVLTRIVLVKSVLVLKIWQKIAMTHSNSQNSVSVCLEAGTHWLCSCGLSKNFPYCNGEHKGTSFQPLALELDNPKVVEITQ